METEKTTYTKSEIVGLLAVQPYIMALWEKQFGITPLLADGQHLYSEQDAAKLSSIKELLYEKGYSIDAAKQYLQENPHILKTTIIAASPLLFESKKEPMKLPHSFSRQLIALRDQLTRLRDLL
jgi:DNA-binding transcriptional MerR regulator